MRKKFFIIVIALLLISAGGFFGYKHFHTTTTLQRSAVFMANGQVYFGYLSKVNQNTVILKDVYYLKTTDLQNSTSKKILLVKMGNELHGPQSTMSINRDQILYWQILRDDSKINDAVARFAQSNQ